MDLDKVKIDGVNGNENEHYQFQDIYQGKQFAQFGLNDGAEIFDCSPFQKGYREHANEPSRQFPGRDNKRRREPCVKGVLKSMP